MFEGEYGLLYEVLYEIQITWWDMLLKYGECQPFHGRWSLARALHLAETITLPSCLTLELFSDRMPNVLEDG